MMTVPMDNLPAPASRELVQKLLKKNIELENKRHKSAQARLPFDPNAWQQMRENYEAIILEDHAFSEQHEIEYKLWQLHYKRIEESRRILSDALASTGSTTAQGGKGPVRPDRIRKIRADLKTFLSEATGFYHDMVLKIQAKYGLPLGYFSEGSHNVTSAKEEKKSAEIKKGLLSCHRCLIYLGDLARYKGLYGEGDSKTRDYAAASSYYLQATSVWPSSGNPHHQLAILASYSGDDLVAVYRYFRSLAVSSPFSTARDNLIIAFEKNRQSYLQLLGDAQASSTKTVPARKTGRGRGKGETVLLQDDSKVETTPIKEKVLNVGETYKTFCIRFVRLNGILFTRTSLETFGDVLSTVSRDFLSLLSRPEEDLCFGSDAADNGLAIVRLIAILIFTVHNVKRETEGQSYAEILQRSVLLQNAFSAVFEFVGHILARCLQLQDPSSSYLLPGIMVFVEWLACHLDIATGSDADGKQATVRSVFWNRCISFLNKLMSSGLVSVDDGRDDTCFSNMSRYDEGETGNRLALKEDFELRGFLPLLPAQSILDFSGKHYNGCGGGKEKTARVHRILAAGRALVNVAQVDQQGVYFDQKLKKFVVGVEPQISEDLLVSSTTHDMPKLNGVLQEDQAEKARSSCLLQHNAQSNLEGEEEDEVIVFKPNVVEKLVDVISPELTTYHGLGAGENTSKSEWASYAGSLSAPFSNSCLPNSLDVSLQPPASLASILHQHPPPISSGAMNWHLEEQAYLVNGMQNLNTSGRPAMKDDFQGGLASLYPPHTISSFPVNTAPFTVSNGQTRAPDTIIPSKFDSVMSSGVNMESFIVKPSGPSVTSLKKNPVSRPVRHLGPPPGFSSAPPKPTVDEFVTGFDLKNENPLVDDYSWLDDYSLSSVAQTALPSSTNNMALHPHVITSSNCSTGMSSFPFPGKQDPNMQVQIENEKIWQDYRQDYRLLELMKQYQEQPQLFQQANQHSAPQLENQGHSMWSGQFFV